MAEDAARELPNFPPGIEHGLGVHDAHPDVCVLGVWRLDCAEEVQKLDLRDRVQAVVLAYEAGLVRPTR